MESGRLPPHNFHNLQFQVAISVFLVVSLQNLLGIQT